MFNYRICIKAFFRLLKNGKVLWNDIGRYPLQEGQKDKAFHWIENELNNFLTIVFVAPHSKVIIRIMWYCDLGLRYFSLSHLFPSAKTCNLTRNLGRWLKSWYYKSLTHSAPGFNPSHLLHNAWIWGLAGESWGGQESIRVTMLSDQASLRWPRVEILHIWRAACIGYHSIKIHSKFSALKSQSFI